MSAFPTAMRGIVSSIFLFRLGSAFLWAMAACSPSGAQVPAPSGPAPVVLLVLDERSAYGTVRLGKEEYGSLKDSLDGSFFLPATGGKAEVQIQAEGCADQPLVLNLVTGKRYVLTLRRVPNPDSKSQSQFSKVLRHEIFPLEGLPEAKGVAEVAALYLQGEAPALTGSVVHGLSEPRTVNLPKRRVVSLGQGKTGMQVRGQQVVFCDPGNEPLVHLFILLEQEGALRAVQAVF